MKDLPLPSESLARFMKKAAKKAKAAKAAAVEVKKPTKVIEREKVPPHNLCWHWRQTGNCPFLKANEKKSKKSSVHARQFSHDEVWRNYSRRLPVNGDGK
jgi:hypothetical protein